MFVDQTQALVCQFGAASWNRRQLATAAQPARRFGSALRRSILLVFVLVSLEGSAPQLQAQPLLQPDRPNILLILTDDQRYDTMTFMPRTKARIFDQGMAFPNAYVTTPLCCPSRASILTGLYAHHHGVHLNSDPLTLPTFVKHLDAAGYYTGLVGKYLNSHDGTPLPEFDYWVGGSDYINPTLNVNGVKKEHTGYGTYLLRDYAQTFLTQAAQQRTPSLLIFALKVPHAPTIPAPGDETLYPSLPLHRPPSYNEADVSDKPEWIQQTPVLTPTQITALDELWKRQLQTLEPVDQAIDSLLTTLETQGKLDRTLVIFLSDNGFFFGEHRLTGKGEAYEEAVKVPFALRYPPLIAAPRVDTHLVANIDIAPTIYELAGLPIQSDIDGHSLVPLLQGKSSWREALLLEAWNTRDRLFTAVHTGQWVYIERRNQRPELYDLVHDPYQVQNQAQNPAYGAKEAEMQSRLRAFQR
jgi:N-acetylglucosamine-6-sulfatase